MDSRGRARGRNSDGGRSRGRGGRSANTPPHASDWPSLGGRGRGYAASNPSPYSASGGGSRRGWESTQPPADLTASPPRTSEVGRSANTPPHASDWPSVGGRGRRYAASNPSPSAASGGGSRRGWESPQLAAGLASPSRTSEVGRGANTPTHVFDFASVRGRGRGYSAAAASPPPVVGGMARGWESPKPQPSAGLKDAKVSVPDIQSLSITPVGAAADCQSKLVPISRPDPGGTSCKRSSSIIVNHFRVNYDASLFVRHYDVDIKPENPPNQARPVKLRKSDLRLIRNQLSAEKGSQIPLDKTVFDGEKNIYSIVDLPTGQFEVKYSEAEDREEKTFLVTVKLVKQFDLSKLREYLSGNLCTIPRDVMQGLDVVMKEYPARRMIISGGCFYPTEFTENDTIAGGLIASTGFQHSLKLTSQGLAMCVDYSVAPFWKSMNVVEFLRKYLGNFIMNDFKRRRREVEKVLRGMKVKVTHRNTSQKFTIRELTTEDTKQLSFRFKDPAGVLPESDKSLVNYFMETYGWEVRHLDIPCLELGRKDKPNHVPMECCTIVPGQRLPKDWLVGDAAKNLKNMSIVAPRVRMDTINRILKLENGPCGGNVIGNFGINVDEEMTKVRGRVIEPPELKIGTSKGGSVKVLVDQERCQWNLGGKCVLEGKLIVRWAMIDFTVSDNWCLNANKFIASLINRCMNLRIRLDNDPVYQKSNMGVLSNPHDLRKVLQHAIKQTEKKKKGKPQIILCVMTKKHDGYKLLKWISETEIGIVTQCLLSSSANKANDQYYANLAMKMNAKLGGSNMELHSQLPRCKGDEIVMFVGADVNHPSQSDPNNLSIAAVVATMNWPGANRYAARVQAQTHRCEQILNFADMCFDLVQAYEGINGRRPDRIMLFRDGVSEGQFDMVLNEELAGLKELFKEQGYSPTLTLIVARKRHQTRLFLEGVMVGDRNANISPGTVVDTTIVHPHEFDFYICSHHGAIGTSKSTHYHVLLDDHGFSSDELEKIIYFLCFTFARCTKPVSLVTPVYYADLVAYRGRMYYEASQAIRNFESSASSASGTSTAFNMKLHSDLENSMFFI